MNELKPSLALWMFAFALGGCMNTEGAVQTTASGGSAGTPTENVPGDAPPERGPGNRPDPAECRALGEQLRECGRCEAEVEAVEACRRDAAQSRTPDACHAEADAVRACHEGCRPLADQLAARCGPPPVDPGPSCHLLHAALATCHGAPPACEPRHRHRRPHGDRPGPEAGVPPEGSDAAAPGDAAGREPPPPPEGRDGHEPPPPPPEGREPPPPPEGRDGHEPPPPPPEGREPPPPPEGRDGRGPPPPPEGRGPPPPRGDLGERCASIERAIAELCAPPVEELR